MSIRKKRSRWNDAEEKALALNRERHLCRAAALAAGAGKLLTELCPNFGIETTIDISLAMLQHAKAELIAGTGPTVSPNAGGNEQ